MIYVLIEMKFTIELNQKFIQNGFFVVKNVGIQYQNIRGIPMEEQENQKYKIIRNFNESN